MQIVVSNHEIRNAFDFEIQLTFSYAAEVAEKQVAPDSTYVHTVSVHCSCVAYACGDAT